MCVYCSYSQCPLSRNCLCFQAEAAAKKVQAAADKAQQQEDEEDELDKLLGV